MIQHTNNKHTRSRRYDVAAAADDEVHKNSLRQPTPKLRRREPQAERERERRDTHRSSHTRRSNDESERRTESRGSSRIVTRKQQLSLTHTHREKEKKEGETTHTQTREQQQQQHKKQKQKSSRRRARTPTSKAPAPIARCRLPTSLTICAETCMIKHPTSLSLDRLFLSLSLSISRLLALSLVLLVLLRYVGSSPAAACNRIDTICRRMSSFRFELLLGRAGREVLDTVGTWQQERRR